ncbi:MAG: ATP-binding cassette domain-containing protein [Bacteroidales bacterium]|nr:ATP-binding cassette domain-containing protein [Bacteroidales bacterium]
MEETILRLKNLSVYRKNNKILSGINFSADKGEFIYLTGKVGSGKSSLLKILYADEEIRTGEVKVAGYDLTKIKQNQIHLLRRKLGIVFQDYKLLTDRNVYDNLKFVLEASGEKSKTLINKKIINTLETVGLKGKEKRMPFELSGGEQQSVGIARALINSPLLILADEPTGNLDEKSSENIMHLLTGASKKGTTVLMATHDMALIKKFPSKIFNVEINSFGHN